VSGLVNSEERMKMREKNELSVSCWVLYCVFTAEITEGMLNNIIFN
jgi:hypothetical protein